jgi:hypothetical protein
MVWKLSVDLTRAVVPSMGLHDPLSGFVATRQLIATAQALGSTSGPDLSRAVTDYRAMLVEDLTTADPLGIGGLLSDACRLSQLPSLVGTDDVVRRTLEAAARGLRAFTASGLLSRPAGQRLAFRELGLAIGLAGVGILEQTSAGRLHPDAMAQLRSQGAGLRETILADWLRTDFRASASWTHHANINEVMLATALVPDGYLVLAT